MTEVTRRTIRSTGREFEEEFSSESAVAAAEAASRFYRNLPVQSGRTIREAKLGVMRVRWFSVD